MKKFFSLLLALGVLVLAGCSQPGDTQIDTEHKKPELPAIDMEYDADNEYIKAFAEYIGDGYVPTVDEMYFGFPDGGYNYTFHGVAKKLQGEWAYLKVCYTEDGELFGLQAYIPEELSPLSCFAPMGLIDGEGWDTEKYSVSYVPDTNPQVVVSLIEEPGTREEYPPIATLERIKAMNPEFSELLDYITGTTGENIGHAYRAEIFGDEDSRFFYYAVNTVTGIYTAEVTKGA